MGTQGGKRSKNPENTRTDPDRKTEQNKGISLGKALIKSMIVAFIVTVVLLVALAFATYQFQWGENIVSLAVVAIYVAATVSAGRIAGKRAPKRKFLWGLAAGFAYFLILAVVSLAVNGQGAFASGTFLTTALICLAGGMLGGMLG